MQMLNNGEQVYNFNITVERVVYKSEEGDFHIISFSTEDEIPHASSVYGKKRYGTLVGNCVSVIAGDRCQVTATVTDNPKFGKQYQIISLGYLKPTTEDEAKYFLSAVITDLQADTLYKAYPDVVDKLANNNSWKPNLDLLPNIGEKTWVIIREKILNNLCYADLISMLSPAGVTMNTIKMLSEKEPNVHLLKQKLERNPYLLCDYPYMSFKKVDRYALNLKPELKDSIERVERGLYYVIDNEENETGSCYISIKTAKEKVRELLEENIDDNFEELLDREKNFNSKTVFYIDDDRVGLKRTYNQEKFIVEKLLSIKNYENVWNIDDKTIEEGIERTCAKQGFDLSEEQKSAIKSIRDNNVTIISGRAGCGKTSVLKGILEVYKGKTINMAALSAKAAKRMIEVTQFPATTIHSMLKWSPQTGSFMFNERMPLYCNLLILDECSMNNIFLFYHVLKAVSLGTKVLFTGDFAQLPPIGTGSVFMDLVHHNVFNNHNLTKVYRQSEDAYIVLHANEIREGKMPFEITSGKMGFGGDTLYLFMNDSERIATWATQLYVQLIEKYGMENVCIVCPRKDTVTVSCQKVNEKIINSLLPEEEVLELYNKEFRVGCRVINKKNNYDEDIVNGDVGTLVEVKQQTVVIDFDAYGYKEIKKKSMMYIELGYAISVHSSQGSQYKAVIVAMDFSSYSLLSCNLVYTAMTRASEKLIILSQAGAFTKAVNNIEENNRATFLSDFLSDEEYIKDVEKYCEKSKKSEEYEEELLALSENENVFGGLDDIFTIENSDDLPF